MHAYILLKYSDLRITSAVSGTRKTLFREFFGLVIFVLYAELLYRLVIYLALRTKYYSTLFFIRNFSEITFFKKLGQFLFCFDRTRMRRRFLRCWRNLKFVAAKSPRFLYIIACMFFIHCQKLTTKWQPLVYYFAYNPCIYNGFQFLIGNIKNENI
jgi:hypothetical protein